MPAKQRPIEIGEAGIPDVAGQLRQHVLHRGEGPHQHDLQGDEGETGEGARRQIGAGTVDQQDQRVARPFAEDGGERAVEDPYGRVEEIGDRRMAGQGRRQRIGDNDIERRDEVDRPVSCQFSGEPGPKGLDRRQARSQLPA